MGRIIVFFLLLINIHCKQNIEPAIKTARKDTALRILVYGLGDADYEQALRTVAKKYGFSYRAVAGCVVSEEFADSVYIENEKTYKILEQRLGYGWRTGFEAEVDTMQQWQTEVRQLVAREKYIVDKKTELAKESDNLYYAIVPTDQNIFNVKVYGLTTINDENTLVIYYKLSVNLSTKTVRLVSSTTERMDRN